MHHPGPPRFLAVGERIELAPRDPDPAASYQWTVADRPAGSDLALGEEPVVEFAPDAAGIYTVELDAPDGTHGLTVRVFPGERAVRTGGGESGYSGRSGRSGAPPGASGSGASGSGALSGGDGGGGRPRIRLDGGPEDGDAVVRAAVSPHPDDPAADVDVEFYVDDRDDATLSASGRTARLSLSDLEEPVRIHAVAIGDAYSVPDSALVHPDGTVENRNEPPAWATEATLYEIYVRGFGDGTFADIEARLGYLADLGVDTLWLTPVLENDDAPHGYNITDFFSIADDLGTRAEYEALIGAAHDHGLRVLFDFVANHSAREHPYFRSAYGNPDSPYREWYEWREDGEPETYFDWPYIANFDFSTLSVRRHLLDVVDEWAGLVDGFRCDMAWAVPDSFWMELRERIKARDAEFLLLDETIPYVADFHGGLFDVHFDTTTYFTLREIGRGNADAGALLDGFEERTRAGFPDHAGFMLYLENHDETRYLVECGRPATEAAAGALFTLPGVPMLYAGQEFGARDTRGRLEWDARDEDLEAHYRALVETRASTPALGYDAPIDRVDYETDGDVVAFRRGEADPVVVALNFGDEPATLSVDLGVEPRDLVSGAAVGTDAGDLWIDSVAVLPLNE